MKECNECNQTKPLTDFPKNKLSQGGRERRCKACRAKWKTEYDRSYEGKLKKIYSKQKDSAKRRGQPLPDYSLEEFINWAKSTSYPQLYTQWETSNFDHYLAPSCDRQDESLSYTLLNLKFTTWKENSLRQQKEVYAGKSTAKTVAVAKLDDLGNILQEYPTISIAARAHGVSQQALGFAVRNNKSCKGHNWQII